MYPYGTDLEARIDGELVLMVRHIVFMSSPYILLVPAYWTSFGLIEAINSVCNNSTDCMEMHGARENKAVTLLSRGKD